MNLQAGHVVRISSFLYTFFRTKGADFPVGFVWEIMLQQRVPCGGGRREHGCVLKGNSHSGYSADWSNGHQTCGKIGYAVNSLPLTKFVCFLLYMFWSISVGYNLGPYNRSAVYKSWENGHRTRRKSLNDPYKVRSLRAQIKPPFLRSHLGPRRH